MAKAFKISDYLDEAKPRSMEITQVPIQLIDVNWKNFYAVDWQEQDLAESIQVSGLLTPLGVVAKDGGHYKLISGHRRLRALKHLHDSEKDGRERWATVPCVIYETPEDADREELMLIHANAQRVKTGPELAKEAQKTTEILTRMKEAGVELPGRMRDRVAEALKISSTRLARLEAIKNNLTYPGWAQKWEKNAITEAVAYRLSQLDYSQQMNAADWVIDHHLKDSEITVKHIEEALAHPPLTNPGCADPLAYEEDPVKVDRELVRRANFAALVREDRLYFENRKDGMEKLKKRYRWAGAGGGGISWDGDPKGIKFREPIEWLLGWGALYDALAANALEDALSGAPRQLSQGESQEAAEVSNVDQEETGASTTGSLTSVSTGSRMAAAPTGWRRCLKDDPEHGQLVAVLDPTDPHMLEVYRFLDGFYTEIDAPEDTQPVKPWMWWTLLGEMPKEAGK